MRQSAAMSFTTQHAMSREIGGTWRRIVHALNISNFKLVYVLNKTDNTDNI